MKRLFKTGEDKLNIEYRLKLANDGYRWVMVRGQVIEYKNSKVKRIVGILTDIHELKEKEQQLRANEQQNSLAMSSTDSSLFHYDLDKQLLKITCFIERNGKVFPDELYGQIHQVKNAIHPDDQRAFVTYYDNFKHSGKRSHSAKWRTNHPTGTYQWQHLKGQVVGWDNKGNPCVAAGISQNIHDSYLIELQANKSNQRYQLAFQDTFHSVWDWDLSSDLLTVNDNLTEKIFHIKAWVPTMFFWLSFIHPEDKDAAIEKLRQQLLNSHEYLSDTYRIKAKTGNWIWIYFKGKVTDRNREGHATRAIGTIIDISDQKSHEFALAHEKELAEKTLQSIGDAVITTDATALITSVNNKAKSLIKFDEKVALGQLLTAICTIYEEKSGSQIQNPFQQCIQSNVPLNLSNLILRSHDDEEFYIDCSVSPIHGTKGTPIGCVMVIRDITRSRKMAHVIEHRAQHDSLTNLFNRHAFDKQLHEVSHGIDFEHTLCYIDLDQFKIVNDTCGHIAGDELLRQLSAKLIEETRSSDVLARLGGDEFGILINDCSPRRSLSIANQVHKCITEHSFRWQDKHFKLTASIVI
ncbi:MAG: hypothetical protein A6F71_08895 [Cycloclasticus sp. symbiont of Poecilosclerida sp. M]|nr:MAG: hypothetical protein A6F71_08895 [Cycloclasticus sp. symbiont of Poecilosclerida sp. M]